jgi:hypothetical protein
MNKMMLIFSQEVVLVPGADSLSTNLLSGISPLQGGGKRAAYFDIAVLIDSLQSTSDCFEPEN